MDYLNKIVDLTDDAFLIDISKFIYNINESIIFCKTNLKNILSNKGISVSDEDSFTTLIDKINELDIYIYKKKPEIINVNLIDNEIDIKNIPEKFNELMNTIKSIKLRISFLLKEKKVEINDNETLEELIDKVNSLNVLQKYNLIDGRTFNEEVKFMDNFTYTTKIIFKRINNLDNILTEKKYIDLSVEKNKHIIGYSESDTIYIVSDGVISANQDSYKMFYDYENLTTLDLSNFNTSNVTDMDFMFYSCRSLTTLDVSNFDTSNVTDMHSMFSYCRSLTTLNVSNFNTSNVTDMNDMFRYCDSLTTLDVSNFNTSNVTDMNAMFYSCDSLITLDLSNFNTSNVTDMSSMFSSCNNLTTLDLSNFNTSNVTDMNFMFYWCISLTTLDVSNFNTSNVTNMNSMFSYCKSLTFNITISNSNMTYVNMFESCSTAAGSKFTVNYSSGCQEIAQNMVNTKSKNSNVVLGVQID